MKQLIELIKRIDTEAPTIIYRYNIPIDPEDKAFTDVINDIVKVCKERSLCSFVEIDPFVIIEYAEYASIDYNGLDSIADAAVFSNYFQGIVAVNMTTNVNDEEYFTDYLIKLRSLTQRAILLFFTPSLPEELIIKKLFDKAIITTTCKERNDDYEK